MKFEVFCKKIGALCESRGVKVKFSIDHDKGLFIAKTSDGLIILGNSVSNRLTARCGKNHQYQFAL